MTNARTETRRLPKPYDFEGREDLHVVDRWVAAYYAPLPMGRVPTGFAVPTNAL